MRHSILVTAALTLFAVSLPAQLAQPPAGVSEGAVTAVTNRCPANPELGNLDATPSWSGWGGAGNARFQTKAASGLTAGRCTQAEAQMELSDFPAARACIRSRRLHSAGSSWATTTVWCIRWTPRPAAFTGPTKPICLAGSLPSLLRSPATRDPVCDLFRHPLHQRLRARCAGRQTALEIAGPEPD